ncbi:MAG: DUF3443 family protein [Myxococcales bacterium]|nr:DUF3443 family protein [Myxococcales bacterium]
MTQTTTRRAATLFALTSALACSSETTPSEPAPEPPATARPADPPPTPLANRVDITLTDYVDGAGKLLRVPVSIGGSHEVGVLLDTGSDGLRVFAHALDDAAIELGDQAIVVEFGGGNRMAGHLATAELSIGEVATAGPIGIHWVESLECAPDMPSCDFAQGTAPFFEDSGIVGILGVSTRPGATAGLESPFAQLDPSLSSGFLIHTDGFEGASGHILFGPDALAEEGFTELALPAAGSLGTGRPAWADDRLELCFSVDGSALDPACTEGVFDTGASVDIVYAPNLPAEKNAGGALAPGAVLGIEAGGAFNFDVTVGAVPTPSLDLVFLDAYEPFAILGIGAFLRHDVRYDLTLGTIGFRAH